MNEESSLRINEYQTPLTTSKKKRVDVSLSPSHKAQKFGVSGRRILRLTRLILIGIRSRSYQENVTTFEGADPFHK